MCIIYTFYQTFSIIICILQRSLGSQKATFIVSPEWISEGTHEAIPSPRRRHEPWSYEYPGAKVRKTGNQVAVSG